MQEYEVHEPFVAQAFALRRNRAADCGVDAHRLPEVVYTGRYQFSNSRKLYLLHGPPMKKGTSQVLSFSVSNLTIQRGSFSALSRNDCVDFERKLRR